MNNIERLKGFIDQIEGHIVDTKGQVANGAGWLDAELDSLERLLCDFRKQLESMEPKECDGDVEHPSRIVRASFWHCVDNPVPSTTPTRKSPSDG